MSKGARTASLRLGIGSTSLMSDFKKWGMEGPAIAGVAVMVGLLVAVLSLPLDVEPRDALRAPALLFTISLCIVPVIAVLRDPKSLFRAEHVLVLAPVYWLLLEPLQGRSEMPDLNREAAAQAFIAIALFVCGSWIAFIQRPWRTPRFIWSASRVELPPEFFFGIGILAFILGFLKYAIPSDFDFLAMAQGLAGGRWDGPWGRGTFGGADAFVDHLSYFGFLLPPLTVLLVRRFGWGNFRSLALGAGSLLTSAFLVQGGGRRLVGIFFGAGIVVWFLGKEKVRLTTIVRLGLLIFGLLFIFEQMLSYRNVGVMAMFDENSATDVDGAGVLVRVDDNFYRLAQTTAIFPDVHPYTTWRYVLWVAVRPVPRLLWPDKPVDPGFDLSQAVGVKGASLSSSVVGELFMAGGFIAVALGGWFYGRLARSLSHFLAQAGTSSALLTYSVGLLALFVGVRSMIELVLTSYVVLAWVGLVHVYDGFRARKDQVIANGS